MLGEFEYLLLSAAARLGDDAYGAAIQQDVQSATGRRCSTGALYTTLPPIFLLTLPIGWAIGGAPAAAAALAAGCLIFAGYEFCHCVQHLPFTPRNAWLRDIKKHHLAHHFHSERGNFGITLDWVDRLLGSGYDTPRAVPRSATTHNLGYDEAERRRYPWVGELSASDQEYAVLRTRRAT